MSRKGLDLVGVTWYLKTNMCRCFIVSIAFLLLAIFVQSNCNLRTTSRFARCVGGGEVVAGFPCLAGRLNVHCGRHCKPIVRYVVIPLAPHRLIIRPLVGQWLRKITIRVIRQFEVASGSSRRAQSGEVTEPIVDSAGVFRYDCGVVGEPHLYLELLGDVLAVARECPWRFTVVSGRADPDCYVLGVVEGSG
jgi:hypothetical protein